MYCREKNRQGLSIGWVVVSVMIITFLYVALPTDFANAFDGKRSGFILGGGAGPAYATVDNDRYYRSRAKTVGAQTAFIIGGGISNQTTISYTGLQFWGDFDSYEEVGFALLPSAEIRYFLSPEAPSAFGTIGFGLALYDNDTYDWGLGGGFAPNLGLGYEFVRHCSVEVHMLYTISPDEGHEPLLNIMLLFTALAY